MANPTTNFGWVMPTSTDLVTDLPADFNVFGQGVDTSLQYLLGGTTGQVLSKTSNTNMAFTWTTPTSSGALTYVGGATFSAATTQSFNNVFTSTYQNYLIMFNIEKTSNGRLYTRLRASGTDNTTSNYNSMTSFLDYASASAGTTKNASVSEWSSPDMGSVSFPMTIQNPQSTIKTFISVPNFSFDYTPGAYAGTYSGFFNATTSFDGFTAYITAGTMTGTIRVYGIANS